MITLKLARGDNYESVPLRLPTTPGEVDEVFAALDAASRYAGEVQIIGVDSGVPSLAKHLKGAGLTDPDAFDKLNRLAEKIDGMDERQRDIFSGALDAESAGSLDDVLRVSDSLEAYTFVPNVRSDEELGRYVVVAGQLHGDRRFPEEAWPYLDFAKIGAEYFAGHGGAYTVSGYVMRREDGQQQVQESKPIFELYLLHGQIRYRLDLPAEELQLDMTKRRLGVEDFAQAAIYQTKCEMEPLAGLLPMDCVSVESANELARTIREMPDGDLLKYLAVLSVEPPADFPGALRLALELDDYERITEGSYGEKNPSNHTGGTEVRNQKEATTTTEGYTGDTYCLGCGEKIASGTVIPKLPSSGGGSSSGGGGGSSTPSVSVPVSSDHGGTKLSATISGSTATVSVSGKEIDKVIADGAKSVTVDLSGLSKVDSVKLPASVIAKTEDAEDTGLTIRLPDGAVGLDEAALESIASGKTVTVSVQQANLTDAQQEAVSALAQVAVVVDVDIVVGTVKQSAFDGGRLTISIPYIPEKGEDTSTLAVWYIRDDGSIENKGGSYDAKSGCFVFETDHLSRYLLVHTEQVMGFTDVPANSWYAGAVAWAVEQGITSGTSDTTFSPNVSCTRAQMVTFLWRASGTPEIGTTSPFSDVSADAYYYDAVLWAVEQGITGGTGGGKFSPDTPCTRAQMATFLWRANGSTEVTGTTPFSDVSAETYYYNAVLWAYEQNITNGTGGGKFSPDATCTRAQMVQMLKNASDAA